MVTRVAYVTGGTRGAGHLVRGLAIARGLERHGADAEFALFMPVDPPFPAIREALLDHSAVVAPIDAGAALDPARAAASRLADSLRRLDPDLVIVDLFWGPLRHILPELDADAWLLLRSCPPVWLQGNDELGFEPGQYRRIVAIEPVEADVITDRIDPVVICNPDQVRSREELCRRFSVSPDRPVAVVSHAGLTGEIDRFGRGIAPGTSVLRFDLHDENAVFPLAPWTAAADEVHCSAGYNSYWEARWLGYAPRTSFTVYPRTIDDPPWRVRTCGNYAMRANGADTLARWIDEGSG